MVNFNGQMDRRSNRAQSHRNFGIIHQNHREGDAKMLMKTESNARNYALKRLRRFFSLLQLKQQRLKGEIAAIQG